MLTSKEKLLTKRFILSREREEGGFSFAATTPPTLEDTYYAVRSLDMLGTAHISTSTSSYISQIDASRLSCSKQTYWLAYLFGRLSHGSNRIETFVRPTNTQRLQDIYYHVLTQELLRKKPSLGEKEFRFIQTQNGKLRAISEVCKYVIIMRKISMPFDKSRYVEWIRKSQWYDGGFGFYPQTTSFLENVYWALRALHALGSKPSRMEECERFIMQCRAKNGGFGRQSTTIPSVEYTYYAISSLNAIKRMNQSVSGMG